MTERTFDRDVLVVLFLLLVVGGASAGVWNQQQIRACHETYDDDPTIAVECEDSFTDVVTFLSLLGIASGVIGLVSIPTVVPTE